VIHNTYLIRISTREILASTKYWPVDVPKEVVDEYITTREDLRSAESEETHLGEIALIVGEHKFHGADLVSDLLLVFVTDKGEDEGSIFEKVQAASKIIRKELTKAGLESVAERYERLVEASVTTRLKIALVGEGGVGKTTTLHLLLGDTPPLQYVPTIALNLETVENIRFGNYSLVLWDFAGQERFRTLWRFYFHGADVIFLVCDSALRNVIISKDILKLIKRDAPKVPVFALANKQDKPNAMKAEVVQKILGIPTYPMVAIDKSRRDEMLRILMTAAAQYVGVALPDLPATELLRFTEAATEEAIAETDAMEERREAKEIEMASEDDEFETIEVIEEVLVDEEGHLIDNIEDYEIVEEVIEEVEEDLFEEKEEEEEEITPSEQAVEDLVAPAEVQEEEAPIADQIPEELAEQPAEEVDEIEMAISEPEEAIESFASDFDFSDEQLVHRELDLIESLAASKVEESVMETDKAPAEVAETSEDEEFEPVMVEDAAPAVISEDISIQIEEEEPSPKAGVLEPELPPEELLVTEPVLEENHGGVELAKEIIFEALDADEFISAELDHISHAEIDQALEAFKSDEAVSVEGEPESLQEIDVESLEELESILGPLDSAVGGTKTEESKDPDDTQHSPIDDESLDELSRLLDFVDSGNDEE
jgi:small GTP-binding protein